MELGAASAGSFLFLDGNFLGLEDEQ